MNYINQLLKWMPFQSKNKLHLVNFVEVNFNNSLAPILLRPDKAIFLFTNIQINQKYLLNRYSNN